MDLENRKTAPPKTAVRAELLIVNDEPGVRRLLHDIFAREGYRVSATGNVAEARALASKSRFDFALIDFKPPVMDGGALPGEPWSENTEMNCRIITGDAAVKRAISAMDAGAVDFFPERLDVNDVIYRLEDALQKQKMQKDTRISLRWYKHLFEHMVDAALLEDISTGNIVDANIRAEKLFGRDRNELIGMHHTGLHPPGKIEHYRKIFEEQIGQGLASDIEGEIVRKDGSIIPVSINASNTGRDGENLTLCLYRDVTSYRRADAALEESLRATEQSLAKVERLARLGNWDWDIESNRLSWSDEIYRIFGLDPGEFAADYEAFLDFVHADDREYVKKSVDDALHGKNPYSIDHRIVLADGEELVVHEQAEVTFDDDGRPVRMFGTVQNITERHRIEADARESNALLGSVSRSLLQYIGSDDRQHMFEVFLESILSLTKSEYGFIAEVIYPQGEDMYLKSHAITDIAWNDETRQLYKKYAPNLEFRNLETLYGAVIKTGEPVIANDPANDSRSSGLPEGHPPLKHFLGLPFRSRDKMIGMVGIANREGGYDDELVEYLQPFLATCSNLMEAYDSEKRRRQAEDDLSESYLRLQKTFDGVVRALVSTTEIRDPYTAGHQKRVAQLAAAIAWKMKLPPKQVEYLYIAATIHDLGKVSIPTDILTKPGMISEAESQLIRMHPKISYEILNEIDFDGPVADIAYQHHERLDGSGYPEGLKGEDIMLEAKILAVADVVEAMVSHRPYRPALGIDQALEEIKRNRGVLFEPAVVDACITVVDNKQFQFMEITRGM